MSDVKPPTSYTSTFDGQGGVAASARARPTFYTGSRATRLGYRVQAPIWSVARWRRWARGIDAAAAKITEDFFAAFEAPRWRRRRPSAAPSQRRRRLRGGKLVWWIVAAVKLLVVAIWWLKR